MDNKIGRNEPCWCGSGKKYKKCHLDRDKSNPVKFSEIDKETKKSFSFKTCLAPESLKSNCSNKIIEAHSIPKKGSLKLIARDGHVYAYKYSFYNVIKNQGFLEPELVGINEASTFNGFCSFHDNEFFKNVENENFKERQDQCFSLGYRAAAMELYKKKASYSLSSLRRDLDRGKTIDAQIKIQEYQNDFNYGVELGLSDITFHKMKYDELLEKKTI